MSDESVQQRVGELLLRAWVLPHSTEQVSLTEEAVQLADSHGDVGLGYEARTTLIEAATFAGFPEKALVAFSWCLAQCDREPERFDDQKLLWQYKWVAADLPYFPQITRARIEEVHEDMQRRYERCGQSLQPIHKIRWLAAMRMGDPETARSEFAAAQQAPRDDGSDCAACEQDDIVNFLIYTGERERAVQRAEPILSGRMSCASVPHVTLASLLRPMLELGRIEEAAHCHQRGWRLVADNRKFIDAQADHLEFLALTRNLDQGIRVLESSLAGALDTTDLDDRFQFYSAATLLGRRLVERGQPCKVNLPRGFPLRAEGVEADELAAWFEAEAGALADTFDARNENDTYRQRLSKSLSLLETFAVPYPLNEAAWEPGDEADSGS